MPFSRNVQQRDSYFSWELSSTSPTLVRKIVQSIIDQLPSLLRQSLHIGNDMPHYYFSNWKIREMSKFAFVPTRLAEFEIRAA